MALKLILYIPTYNRYEKLKNCLDIVEREIAGLEDCVRVFVSDNCSTDATGAYLDGLRKSWLQVRRNERNLGAYGNILQCFNLPLTAEFVWMIGDDDYLMPGALAGILELIAAYPSAHYIFCNTKAFPAEHSAAIMQHYRDTGEAEGGVPKSRKYVGTALVEFEKIIDPQIADTLLAELMCNCFRQASLRLDDDGVNRDLDAIDWETVELDSLGKLYAPQLLPVLQSFDAKTHAVYCDTVRTFNFWGSAEWLGNYDFVFPILLAYLIEQYKARGFIDDEKFFGLLDYYYRTMRNSLLRQAEGSSTARPFNTNVKAALYDLSIRFLTRPLAA
jgi:glycosyltransferase involved in cell wall biosynthesis